MRHAAWIVFAAALVACSDAPTAPELGATPLPDAAPDTFQAAPDAGAEGGTEAAPTPDSAPDSAPPSSEPDAGPEATPDAAPPLPDADAAPPKVDAAGPDVDAATVRDADAGSPSPICSSPDPSCKAATDADAAIQAAFPPNRYACADGARQCGTLVQSGLIMTYPMVCRSGAWRLAGGVVSGRWVAGYECSASCGVGRICDP
jgi:hypothetical protein